MKNSENITSQEKPKSFANLKTKMLKNFDIKAYKNLPNYDVPLDYNTPEKKSKLKKYFIDVIKSSLHDVKKDDVNSTIKKLELILYYFTNMNNN